MTRSGLLNRSYIYRFLQVLAARTANRLPWSVGDLDAGSVVWESAGHDPGEVRVARQFEHVQRETYGLAEHLEHIKREQVGQASRELHERVERAERERHEMVEQLRHELDELRRFVKEHLLFVIGLLSHFDPTYPCNPPYSTA